MDVNKKTTIIYFFN